jgi:TetR/AcrR family transcriptional regulator, mexJK operon transcriptional repressor
MAHRPVDLAKQDAILAAARAEFFSVGYAAASIERIAAAAAVSKVTIYNRFQNKERLFSAVIGNECVKMRGEIQELSETSEDLRSNLMAFAWSILRFLSSPDIIRFERMIAAEVERYPEMGTLFLNAGPYQMKALIAQMFAEAMGHGLLVKDDPEIAAAHFYGMVKGFNDIEWRFLNADDAARSLDANIMSATVDRFLRAYRP